MFMELFYGILFVIIIFGVIAIVYVYSYNKIQHFKSKIEEAESLIDENLRTKYDTLVNVDTLLMKLLKNDKHYFKDIDKLKKEDISNFDLDRKLTEYENLLKQIKIDNSKLADNKDFKELTNELKTNDEKLAAVKTYYNRYTSDENELIRTFPSNIVSKMHGINIKPFFDGKNMQDDNVEDFKF